MANIAIIGSGFSGMSAASYFAKAGHKVEVFEKNEGPGGRAGVWKKDGFTFDMGPSWYWMPDVFESYFADFGKKVSDYYQLEKLGPSYRVYFKDDFADVYADREKLKALFESYEPGSGRHLDAFLKEAEIKYEVGMKDLVKKPGQSIFEYMDWRVFKGLASLHLLKNMRTYVRSRFKHPKLQAILEFPVLFLGERPQKTPGLYSLMNHADLTLGTWYPKGGMHEIAKAMHKLAEELGVVFHFNEEVKSIQTKGKKAESIETKSGEVHEFDLLVSGADYEHTDQKLIPKGKSNYSPEYWDKRAMAPGSILYFLGIDRKVPELQHHNLFFDSSFDEHADAIYENPSWVENPLFYACCPSKTDESVAPEGKENLFILIPTAPGLVDSEETREAYFQMVMHRLEERVGVKVRDHVVVRRDFGYHDFRSRYNSFKGNAYGLANTLRQTGILKPEIRSKSFSNMFFTGQLTVPGPGVPPSLISGELVANYANRKLKNGL